MSKTKKRPLTLREMRDTCQRLLDAGVDPGVNLTVRTSWGAKLLQFIVQDPAGIGAYKINSNTAARFIERCAPSAPVLRTTSKIELGDMAPGESREFEIPERGYNGPRGDSNTEGE